MSDTEVMLRGETMPELEITRLTDGLGFGNPDGISFNNRTDVTPEKIDAVESFITSKDILVPVDKDQDGKMLDDDGCGDGRGWKKIIMKVGDTIHNKTKSLNRAKQFGGGLMMATVGLIATGRSVGAKLRETVSQGIGLLEEKRLGFGAHTDDHPHGSNCGCGAIDKAPQILQNAIVFESQIRDVLTNVIGVDDKYTEIAYGNIRDFLPTMDADAYEGASVADEIIEEGKVVKELTGPHLEMYILLNEVFGFTADQSKVREISDESVQVFSVDLWRVRQQVDDTYDEETDREVAFAGALIYTLATAGTLTAGDLPVYVIKATA